MLPTIYEEDESFCESDEEQAESQTSCFTEQHGLLKGLPGLLEPITENEEACEASQQVDVLPTFYEENESFCETDEEQVGPQSSCLTEQEELMNDSPDVFEPSLENGDASETSQQVNTFS